MNGLMILAQASAEQGGSFMAALPGLIVMLIVGFALIGGMWKLFEKAGEPGWAAIVPIYNAVVLLKIAGKPAWWIVLFFIPLVNLVVTFVVAAALSEKFGKGIGFALGLVLLPYVFYPILGFGGAQYRGA